ncbi:MAG: HNH endonuclease [Acidobacteriota bacterium]|nr:MAG: HNH endonuclease [Acidobacteriota bacterium]
MAIADVCVERGSAADEWLEISSRELAEKFIFHYWNQAAPYGGIVLLQNNNNQAAVISTLETARRQFGTLGNLRSSSRAWRSVVSKVAGTVKEQPLWKLQRVGGEVLDFLYPHEDEGSVIRLRPGIAYCFRTFYPLIKDLVEGHWLMFVRQHRVNQQVLGRHGDLRDFLFGSNRQSLKKFQPVLLDIQESRCFYCDRRFGRVIEVDHFIPWSMYSYDLGHNFVLSCKSCNGDKSARLASAAHLRRWVDRNIDKGDAFTEKMKELDLLFDLDTTLRVAEFAYGFAESTNAQTWVARRNKLEPLKPGWRKLIEPSLSEL